MINKGSLYKNPELDLDQPKCVGLQCSSPLIDVYCPFQTGPDGFLDHGFL